MAVHALDVLEIAQLHVEVLALKVVVLGVLVIVQLVV